MSNTVFLSTVTNEFGAFRSRLAQFLQRLKRIHVRHQDDFFHHGVKTLRMLEEEVTKSDLVVHIIGAEAGWAPPKDQVADFLERHPDFEAYFPEVASVAKTGEVTATQWEAWLGIFFGQTLSGEPRRVVLLEFPHLLEKCSKQKRHSLQLRDSENYPQEVHDEAQLYDEVLGALIETGFLTRELVVAARAPLLPLRNSEFFGAEEQLEDLGKRFSTENVIRPNKTAAIKGDGGVGKTQLSIEFAHRCLMSGSRNTVLWCNAESDATFDQDLATHAHALGAPAELADKKQLIQYTLEWLRRTGDWLLVADNADDPGARDHVANRFLGHSRGWLLVTTRLRDPGPEFSKVELNKLTLDRAADFLMLHAGAKGTRDEALEIAKELDGLFLALAWAVAELRESGDSFHQLLERYRKAPLDVISSLPEGWGERRSVLKCWITSYERLSPLARRLLLIMAWFAPERIREEWLTRVDWLKTTPAIEGLEYQPDDHTLGDAVRELYRRRFCTREAGVLSLHRLIQLSARTKLLTASEGQAQMPGSNDFLESAIALLLHTAPSSGEHSWDALEWIESFPHTEVLFKHVRKEELRSVNSARLCYLHAQSQRSLRRLHDSIVSHEVAIDIASSFLSDGVLSEELALWYNTAACSYCKLEDYEAARFYMGKVREHTDRALAETPGDLEQCNIECRWVVHDACTALHWAYALRRAGVKDGEQRQLERAGLAGRDRQLVLSKKLRDSDLLHKPCSYLQALSEAGHAYRMAGDKSRAQELAAEGLGEFNRLRERFAEGGSGLFYFTNCSMKLSFLLFNLGENRSAKEVLQVALGHLKKLGGSWNIDTYVAHLLLIRIEHSDKPSVENLSRAQECLEVLRQRLEPTDRTLRVSEEGFSEMRASLSRIS